ncbi:MAG TPA: hypothetical protein VEB21_09825 [Terriglobales bacterium]|nr:hypothetical protein [Terriglobales bacterium]
MNKQEQQDSHDHQSGNKGRKLPTSPNAGIARPFDTPEDSPSGHHEEPTPPRGRAKHE